MKIYTVTTTSCIHTVPSRRIIETLGDYHLRDYPVTLQLHNLTPPKDEIGIRSIKLPIDITEMFIEDQDTLEIGVDGEVPDEIKDKFAEEIRLILEMDYGKRNNKRMIERHIKLIKNET